MDLAYDCKFEEMKKYIPFLESMITRLESTSLSSNPRQAQLDKIRSLRDLLLDKKKRMKMENLLKCEQVLVNLYAKVEQRDSITGIMKVKEDSVFSIDSPTPKEKSELEAVRNKLKSVAKIQEEQEDTLPEIARASEVQEVSTSGKEPALFQRRPNKSSISPIRHSPNKTIEDATKSQGSNSKRNYTRVLVSPEASSRRWSPSGKPEEKPLFSRRSPRRSPRRYSPSFHKRERKKTSKESNSQKSNGINITLNVPQESLNSLNTRDILPRIINCSDGDVDIDTLRELRKQILGELKKTGANDDISDLILKSYNNKKRRTKKRDEVEEGELSDSESEAIENIYGSLVVKDQNSPGQSKNLLDKDNHKIQICLVINSDKESNGGETTNSNKNIDASDFEMYNKDEATEKVKKSEVVSIDNDSEKSIPTCTTNKANVDKTNAEPQILIKQTIDDTTKQKVAGTSVESGTEVQKADLISPNLQDKAVETLSADSVDMQLKLQKEDTIIETKSKDCSNPNLKNTLNKSDEVPPKEKVPFKANFYNPIVETDNTESVFNETKSTEILDSKELSPADTVIGTDSPAPTNSVVPSIEDNLKNMDGAVEIPLINEPQITQQPAKNVVSEIEILQALKNDILSESLCIPGSETKVPLLHQPKVIKVAKGQDIFPKKRISIEKYKEKSVKPPKIYLLPNEPNNLLKEDQMKKSKLKLTEKECERFNIPKISFDEDENTDDDDVTKDFSVDEIYSDLAPKSPDHDESSNIESTPPVIIPADPVKTVTVNHKADVDMRSLSNTSNAHIPSIFGKQIVSGPDINVAKVEQNYIPPLTDPRVRRDHRLSNDSLSPRVNPEGTPRPVFVSSTPNVLPNRTPVMTPNARSYEMTPSHQTFDVEQGSRKHVYAPSFSAGEAPDMDKFIPRDSRAWENPDKCDRRSRFEDSGESSRKWDDRDPRSNSAQTDMSQKSRYSESFSCNNATRNDRCDKREERPYSRSDCPLTPLPSFGRSDAQAPSVPSFAPVTHVPFVRGDCPTTPIHPFGRSDCPTTPIHPFGRMDCPLTPSHPFGRSECPSTPIHPFGRSDGQQTPNPYAQDVQYNHNMFNRFDSATSPTNSFNTSDCPQNQGHSFGRSDRSMMPSHTFGMSECTKSTSRPFGRSDKTTNKSSGRSEFNSKFTKDPRLNRKSEYESNKEREYNRSSSYKPPKSYVASESYRNFEREHSMSRGDKHHYYADKGRRPLNRDGKRFEHGRSVSRDYENDQHSREMNSRNANERSYEEVGSRRFQRERSVGRTGRSDENYRSTSRAPSVGRAEVKTADNKFSVKPDAGRSFTIDTSVNTTFQELIESGKGIQVFDYSFDARRQRASSVGRSLVRESSVGRTLSQSAKTNDGGDNKRDTFRRASSVGRDLAVSKTDRSFQDIKADFETYKSSTSELNSSKSNKFDEKTKKSTEPIQNRAKTNIEKEKLVERKPSISSAAYSPRKNTRDPRMIKKMNYKDPRTRREEKAANVAQRKSSGIDYSSDNIAKGTILGSGCGVKNYKIPKIKRPVEEIEKEHKNFDKKEPEADVKKEATKAKKKQGIINEKSNDKVKGKVIEKVKEKEQTKGKEAIKVETPKVTEKTKPNSSEVPKEQLKVNVNEKINETSKIIDIGAESNDSIASKSNDNLERRITRSSAKSFGEMKSPESSPIKARTRKTRKNILCDSDSESDNASKAIEDNVKVKLFETEKKLSPIKHNKTNNGSDVDLDSSFGIEELEMFHDNAVSDPEVDNISALIADLDNHIDTTRNENSNNFTNEITLENMFDSINSPENTDSNSVDMKITSESETAISAIKIQNDTSSRKSIDIELRNTAATDIQTTDSTCEKVDDEKQAYNSTTTDDAEDNIKEKPEKAAVATDFQPVLDTSIHEDIVSTTHIDPKVTDDKSKINEHNTDSCSTPDSTINSDENVPEKIDKEGLADSTNEVHNETVVTSTDSLEVKVLDEASTDPKQTPALDSIGSLLSLLQDKSRIKEVLSMLGGQSIDNEKIKKKLEKLSEIMSDEEGEKQHEEQKELPLDKGESPVPNVHDKSVPNIGDGSTVLEDSTDTNKVKLGEENVDKNSRNEETVNVDPPIEEVSKESHEITTQNDADIKESHENIEAEETEPEANDEPENKAPKPKKRMTRKSKFGKKGKGKKPANKIVTNLPKRVTRAGNNTPTIPKIKKPSRELLKLQEDIKEMFIRDDVLSSTGLRMCRIAKLVDDKNAGPPENEPVVVLEKFKTVTDPKEDTPNIEKVKRKKPGPKPKKYLKNSMVVGADKPDISMSSFKYKPGPKSKTKHKKDCDPYAFESDSVETNTEKASDEDIGSDSESSSVVSSRSFGSTECLADIKKKNKRKRPGWQAGVIKPKYKKKKVEPKATDSIQDIEEEISRELVQIPDKNCFTDRTYFFRKNLSTYGCRLCTYTGNEIVHHYKKQHPHIEIPLSRMAPMTAKLAIEQCTEINFQAICKIPSEKYVCIFCYQEFSKKTKSILETFFWHIVSMHTGEYKQLCTECVQDSQCPFTLDIPSPPKAAEGQLIGYICKKCNFTQISLENIKTHVIVRHNDEQTAVYTINLSAMSKKALNKLLRHCNAPGPARMLRSCRSNQSLTEASDDCSDITETSSRFSESESVEPKDTEEESLPESKPLAIQAKITFETEEHVAAQLDSKTEIEDLSDVPIKTEIKEPEVVDEPIPREEPQVTESSEVDNVLNVHEEEEEAECEQPAQTSDDIVDYPHFKISFTESGAKEYICCINRQDRHFKTTLLISMKKHVQMKHSEIWDGYCYICKVIVTPQGAHRFKECLQHYLDQHIDSFPVLEVATEPTGTVEPLPKSPETISTSKTYIHVRPLSQLISAADEINLPKIERVVSLGAATVEVPRPSPNYPPIRAEKPPLEKQFKYEEAQAEVMSKKHRVVLDTMMARDKLINVYKCAGRFCSFTTDSAEDALLHASTHQRIGGADALNCSYCDFDSTGNAIDLVMHVFKSHGSCQYSCGQCFYRAAASQLVGAHMARVHATMAHIAVLRTTTATTPVTEANMLSRDQAVQYYVCAHVDQNEKCKFRTYTPDKFADHLQQRHSTATSHPCQFCKSSMAKPVELVEHMKFHGLRLYQCTWCVHGADSEGDLLAHVSSTHPSKQPQAYLRIITNKDGSNELRVLPLAFLNKTKILTEDVSTSAKGQDPVREAERSIQLETLIGHANLIAEATNQSTETSPPHDEQRPTEATVPPIENIESDDLAIPEREATPLPAHVTPPRTDSPHDISLQKTPILKMEPPDTPSKPPDDVVLLDSDEDDHRPGVIDLSEEEATTSGGQKASDQHKKIPLNMLFRCPKCKILCKAIHGLKKHATSCLPVGPCSLKCPHCTFLFTDRSQVYTHYMMDHRDAVRHECGVCGVHFTAITTAKRHVKAVHHTTDVEITQKTDNGVTCLVVGVPKRQRVQPKRKLSATAPEPAVAKRRHWSPEDIDKLPINPILDQSVHCSLCEFSTKVRLNMVRHLQMHADQRPVPQTAPVNPVPHLETNEKHFDKMVNLASSSLRPERPAPPAAPPAPPAPLVPPEAAARYPRHVPDRQRLTCGARGCSYISLDEQMLRIHWDTLHSGTTDYHCVHCPPYQHLDTSKPLTASRILAHLKMHDVNLYACSACCYYHYKREALEKHLSEVHKGGKLMIVREEGGAAPPAAVASPAAPTMDLKPWQCGLCKFKSMLRPAVIDHCAKLHQSKMQYKCAYCPFRTSAIENINKHQTNSHLGKPEDVFYYYYREDSVPDDADGTPRWQRQRQKCGITESEIKTESSPTQTSEPTPNAVTAVSPAVSASTNEALNTPLSVDLNLVKKEVEDVPSGTELDIEELCKKYGQFCDPNGLHFTCPLCKVVAEDNRDAMQCHLYEELKYRRWGCGLCSYKAFHKNGLNDHMSSEHHRQYTDHIKLPVDINMEKWVTAHLDHQKTIIDKNKGNLQKLKQAIARNSPGPSNRKSPIPETVVNIEKYSVNDLEAAFGSFGTPSDMEFCCSKCKFTTKDEGAMKDHLESELTKIRWRCSVCPSNFQTYHEAQFHVKSHVGEPARPREASRDPALRAAWVTTAVLTQKQAIKAIHSSVTEKTSPEDTSTENENSLLVVRYEERVPTPEDSAPVRRKRTAPSGDADGPSQKKADKSCPYCDFKTKYQSSLVEHIPRHFNLKPFSCSYCDFNGYRPGVMYHMERCHPGLQPRIKHTEVPPDLIANFLRKSTEDASKLICLHCEKAISENETAAHVHDDIKPEYAKKGDVVVKCCICLVLRIDMKSYQEHHNAAHPDIPINYALFKLYHDTRETNYCGYCNKGFKYLRDLKTHHNAVHSNFQLMYTSTPYSRMTSEDVVATNKRCARKSTTKLPNTSAVAKKSTTKLPDYGDDGFSYYNTRSSLEEYDNVTTLLPICNTMMPFTFKKLKEFLNVEPNVLVKDIQRETNDSSDE